MALRLIDPTVPAPAPAPAPALILATLTERAQRALRTQDFAAYAALAADAGELAGDQARYVARRVLVEIGLEERAQHGDAPAVLLATADLALTVLDPAPSEPFLLNLAGVALYELGALRGAEALWRAALSLDPHLEHLRGNVRELKRRRKQGVAVKLPVPITRELPALERRAAAIAGRTGHAPAGRISLCMIVRDEERVLERCLASAVDAVDEVIVVDTGSTDGTKAIAERFGARVVDHVWTDDFAAARNAGVELASGDWILFLDADEALAAEDAPKLRGLTRRTWREAFRLAVHNRVGADDERRFVVSEGLRLFRNRPEYRFDGRVHEGVGKRLPADAPERIETVAVRIDHDGYLHSTRVAKDKTRRNMELLERELAESGEGHFVLYNLGSEHAAIGDHTRAADLLGRAWDLLLAESPRPHQPFAPSLAVRYTSALRNVGRREEAVAHAARSLELFEGFTDLVYEQACIAHELGDLQRAEALLRRCLEMGDAPERFLRVVGAGTFNAAGMLATVLLARGEAAEAAELVLGSLAEHPYAFDLIEPAVRAVVALGRPAEQAVAEVCARVGELTPNVRFLLGATLHGIGASEAAEAQLRAAVEGDPQDDAARVALAETLLSQSRWADAGAEAAAVPDDARCALAAVTTQAFAAIAGADPVAAPAALERATRLGLPEHDRAALTAWAAGSGLVDGPAPAVPAAGLGLLVTSLEALLRVHAFDAFAALLPVAEAVDGVPARERREVLAAMYLRRGFLDSAAEEWAAAVDESGPDARALHGLSRVAAARGDAEDAEIFAEAAQELLAA